MGNRTPLIRDKEKGTPHQRTTRRNRAGASIRVIGPPQKPLAMYGLSH
jgi:hypothetical protein